MQQARGESDFNNVEFNVEANDAYEPYQGATDEQPSKEVSKFFKLLEDMDK